MRRLKRMGRKFVSAALALTMTLGLVATGNIANITQVKAASALESNDFLKVNGTQIRKIKGKWRCCIFAWNQRRWMACSGKLDESH